MGIFFTFKHEDGQTHWSIWQYQNICALKSHRICIFWNLKFELSLSLIKVKSSKKKSFAKKRAKVTEKWFDVKVNIDRECNEYYIPKYVCLTGQSFSTYRIPIIQLKRVIFDATKMHGHRIHRTKPVPSIEKSLENWHFLLFLRTMPLSILHIVWRKICSFPVCVNSFGWKIDTTESCPISDKVGGLWRRQFANSQKPNNTSEMVMVLVLLVLKWRHCKLQSIKCWIPMRWDCLYRPFFIPFTSITYLIISIRMW